jgi:magnesium and cobalt exporter, CNNM family
MELSSALGLIAVVMLVLTNGFFVATEFAIVAVRRSRLQELAQEGRAAAAAAIDVVAHLDAYIAATQFGITLASLALGWIGEPALAHLLEPTFELLVGRFGPAAAHGVAIGVAFAIITGLHIVLGELAPKGLALQRPESTTLWVARPIQIFHAVFKWPITALNTVGNSALKVFGLEPASGHEMVHSVEELRLLVTGMQKAGVVDPAEARIARRAFAFSDLTASALMTPRTEVEAVSVTAELSELLHVTETTRHSRLPVYEGSLDNVLGILYVRDVFRYCRTQPDSFDVRMLIRPPLIVPETKYGSELIEDMRSNRTHIALVVDEYGGTAGIITLIDLLEALVGPIEDGPAADNASVTDGRIESDGSVLLDGLMRVEEFEEVARLRLDDQAHEGVDTLGGLIAAVLGRFPKVGEEVEIGGRILSIEALDGLRIAAVRLLPQAPSAPQKKIL